MDEGEAVTAIRALAAAGRVFIHPHAARRMEERRVSAVDVRHALSNATSATMQVNRRRRVEGADIDGLPLTMVVELGANVVVVTLF